MLDKNAKYIAPGEIAVYVDGNITAALKFFKRRVFETKKLSLLYDKQYFIPKSEKLRKIKEKGIYRQKYLDKL